MNSKDFDFIMDDYKGLKRDRALRIISKQLTKGDGEYCQYMKNELVSCRRSIIKDYKSIERLIEYREVHLKNLEFWQDKMDIVKVAETQLQIAEIDKIIKDLRKLIAGMGGLVGCILRSNILSEHDVCQLLNINTKTWERKKADYLSKYQGKEAEANLIYNIIAMKGPEYRKLKSRKKGFYDCPEYEMPIYWAIHEQVIDYMKNHEEVRAAARKKFKQLFTGIKTYQVLKDLEGNIVELIEEK